MRGKEYVSQVGKQKRRITPAYAGKSEVCFKLFAGVQDHPRVCGEKAVIRSSVAQAVGSPPRMRGKEYAVYHGHAYDGITPAYAGKSTRPIPLLSFE